MAAKAGGQDSLQGHLMEAATSVTRAMGTPEAASPPIAAALGKIQTVLVGLARGGGMQPQAQPGGGGQPGAGMGPPGGGAVNPAMPSLTGGQMPPAPPGAGATMGIPQPSPDELRRMIASST